MKHILRFFIFSLFISIFSLSGIASPRYHCPKDSARVMEIISLASHAENFPDRVIAVAKALVGTPLAKAADNDTEGTIVVRLDSLNQREFLYITLAAAKTAGLSYPNIRDFEKNLENISRRKGKDEGFPSQFLYGADWIVDNVYRGNLKEMTEYLDGGSFRTKTLDYVSRHPEEFPALSNPEILDKVKVVEYGYRSHRLPHLKKQSIGNKNVKELLQEGDIIILSAMNNDFDIYDIGFVTFVNGEPTLIHVSHHTGGTLIDPFPLTRLFKNEGQYFYGYRWLRPVE